MTAKRAGRSVEPLVGTSPDRTIVGSFSSYLEAERSLEMVERRGLPAEDVAIVAQDVHIASEDSGAARFSRMAEAGAAGATVGALAVVLSWLFGLWDDSAGIAVSLGASYGALCGLAAEVVLAGRRHPGSDLRLVAERYDLTVDPRLADPIAAAIADRHNADGSMEG